MLLSEVFLQSEGAHCIGDINTVTIGENTNVQDRAVLASAKKSHYSDGTLKLGSNITIGHGAILNACQVDDFSLIGMGAVLEEGCHVGSYSMVGAGSVVEKQQEIPSGEVGKEMRVRCSCGPGTPRGLYAN